MRKLILVCICILMLAGTGYAGGRSPQGIYGDQFNLQVWHFQGDLVSLYQTGLFVARWSFKTKGDYLILSPASDRANPGKMYYRNEGAVLHLRVVKDSPGIFYKRRPGTIKTVHGYLE